MALRRTESEKAPGRTWTLRQETRDGCVSGILSFQLQKSPTPNFEEKCGNSPDISKGISQSGMCKFESSQVSQAVGPDENPPVRVAKKPANGGLLQLSGLSPDSQFMEYLAQIAESLWPFIE
jgi:hypothetical protein